MMISARYMIRIASVLISCLAAVVAADAQQQDQGVPTKVMIRAVSRDAKVIGTKVGGARITVRDVSTGAILAEGIQKGETGNTDQIMVQPRKRGVPVFDTPGTAGFLATVMLKQPTMVEVTAVGPLGTPQSTQRVSKTLLLIPGQDVLGDGIVLEIHGFTVTLLAPQADARPIIGTAFEVRTTVTLT